MGVKNSNPIKTERFKGKVEPNTLANLLIGWFKNEKIVSRYLLTNLN